jgi:hypothetical protein
MSLCPPNAGLRFDTGNPKSSNGISFRAEYNAASDSADFPLLELTLPNSWQVYAAYPDAQAGYVLSLHVQKPAIRSCAQNG